MEKTLELIKELLLIPWVRAICLVVLSIVIAKLVDRLFTIILRRMALKTRTKVDDKLIEILHRPIYYSLLFSGLGISIRILQLPDWVIFIFLGIFKSLAIVIWGMAIFKMFIHLINWYAQKSRKSNLIQERTIPLFDNLGKMLIFAGVIYFIFLSWDIDVTGWVASAGILSVVIGFAAKDTLANLFSGIFIMADSPYKEGDYINLDSGERGYVRNIGIRSTRIMTRDDIEITIPNSVIANSKIVNESGGPNERERIRITVSVAYGSDVDRVKEILFEIASGSDNICTAHEPRIRFRQFGDNGLIFQLMFWIEQPASRGRIVDEINSKIYKAFNKENIEIPYPQRTIHIQK